MMAHSTMTGGGRGSKPISGIFARFCRRRSARPAYPFRLHRRAGANPDDPRGRPFSLAWGLCYK
jgi:hypothetical protein